MGCAARLVVYTKPEFQERAEAVFRVFELEPEAESWDNAEKIIYDFEHLHSSSTEDIRNELAKAGVLCSIKMEYADNEYDDEFSLLEASTENGEVNIQIMDTKELAANAARVEILKMLEEDADLEMVQNYLVQNTNKQFSLHF